MTSRVLVVHGRHGAEHQVPPDHPDQPSRLGAVARGITSAAEHHDVIEVPGRLATIAELERVHTPEHVQHVRDLGRNGGGPIGDDETFVSPASFAAALGAAGAGLVAAEQLGRDATHSGAFAVTRPAGHHASAGTAGGFCIFNNLAVTAAHLIDRGARITVVDWDAHHGNGTQEIFREDLRVQYVSLHQESIFPGTGLPHERGPSSAVSTTVNLPLPAGATADHYLDLLRAVVEPRVAVFDPDWVLVSCGFDAHIDDPHADLALRPDDFALLTERVMRMAPRPGRVILFLEGGYDLDALEASTAAVLGVLAGASTGGLVPSRGGPGALRVAELRRLWA